MCETGFRAFYSLHDSHCYTAAKPVYVKATKEATVKLHHKGKKQKQKHLNCMFNMLYKNFEHLNKFFWKEIDPIKCLF